MKQNLFVEIREAGVATIAKQLGLTVLDFPEPGSVGPCPSCSAEKRGTGDRRGPIGLTRNGLGWICHRCKVSGDALSLAAVAVTGNIKPNTDGWRDIRHRFLGTSLPTFIPKPREEYRRPPMTEVLELWHKSKPLYDSAKLVSLFEQRGLDPNVSTELNLCRALPSGRLPDWAYCGRSPWNQSGHICLFPLYDHQGQLQSLHARRMGESAERPKGLSPIGYEVKGLLFAEPCAQQLLLGRAHISEVIITEGAPDYLAALGMLGDANESSAVLSVISGSWTQDFANKIPAGTKVILATHNDSAGNYYAQQIFKTLAPGQKVSRWRYPDE